MPLLSIIIPIYNVEKYLRDCLDSVLKQTLQDIQIILVDDGSPDGCPEICDEYALLDRRISVIHQQNAGLGMARNSGLKIAKGKFVAFLDSDDFVLPDMYEKMVAACEAQNADLVICNQYSIGSHKIPVKHAFGASVVEGKAQIYSEVITPIITPYHPKRSLLWGVGPKVYRRSVITDNEVLFTSVKYAEDWIFSIQLYRFLNKIVFIEDYLFCYRMNVSGSLSTKKGIRPGAFKEACMAKRMIAKLYPESMIALHVNDEILNCWKRALVDFVACRGIKELYSFAEELRQDCELKNACHETHGFHFLFLRLGVTKGRKFFYLLSWISHTSIPVLKFYIKHVWNIFLKHHI